MQQETNVCPKASELCEELAFEMEKTHAALVAFAGEEFVRHLEAEDGLVQQILKAYPHQLAGATTLRERLTNLLRQRRILLRSSRRTVMALAGVCAVSRGTYGSSEMNGY